MKKYVINKIFVDGYERIMVIRGMESDVNYTVHFLEYDEYLSSFEQSKKMHVEGIIEGSLYIDLVTVNEKTDLEMMHEQRIKDSSHIEAIVEVCEVINDYSIYANSTIINDRILIEFENMVDYSVGDKIRIEGSLEISEVDAV